MEKTFSKIEIAVIKRTAQNVAQFVNKKEKINAKIAELEAERESLQPIIDSFQGPIKELTGGYTTEDLVKRETVHTGKIDTKTGKEILQARFVLKYPETVVPVQAEDCHGYDDSNDEEDYNEMPEELLEEQAEEAPNGEDSFNQDDWL